MTPIRSMTGFARDRNGSAVLLHNAVHGRQAQAGSLPRLLRGEKRLEDTRYDFRFHSATRIDHR